MLFLGVTSRGNVVGFVTAADSQLAGEFIHKHPDPDTGVFTELTIPVAFGDQSPKIMLLAELCRIHQLGWIDSKRLSGDGSILPCKSTNCGGYTLEAELGIIPNGRSEPDYLGYEIKQTSVSTFGNPTAGVITLMTPEPNGGLYTEADTREFLCYPDKMGREDRINFGGNFKVGHRNGTTGLTMHLLGYAGCFGRKSAARTKLVEGILETPRSLGKLE